MTHDANDRPRFYGIKKEAHWLFHNVVGHPLVGVLGFVAGCLHNTGSTYVAPKVQDFADALHDWTMPER